MQGDGRAALANMLHGVAEVAPDHPFPWETVAQLFEHVMERMRVEVDDARMIETGEDLLRRARERAAAERFQ